MALQNEAQQPPMTADKGPAMSPARLWVIVIFLMIVGMVNYIDRLLPSVLAEPIKRDFSLSDGAIGLINGFGFLLIYSIASIPMARLADRGHYAAVITASLGVWSAMTVMSAFAAGAWQLAIARMGVALGEAGAIPASHAFISRNVPVARRARALAIFTLSLPLGIMMGNAAGGLMGGSFGWRATFFVMGVVGLLLAVVAALLIPRGRTRAVVTTAAVPVSSLKTLLAKKSFVAIVAGAAFMGAGGYAAGTFSPAFLMRSHGLSVGEAGAQYGITSGIIGIVGLLATGWLADRMARRDPRWTLGTVALVITVFLPICFVSFSVSDKWLAILALSFNAAITNFYVAPAIAAAHRLATVDLRAQASAIIVISSSICGGIGAFLAGTLSDALAPEYGVAALGHALIVIPISYSCAVLCFLAAIVRYAAEILPEASAGGGDAASRTM